MHRIPRSRPCRAFTLVELLVVISIIGLLMALLLPAVQGARETGRRTACVTNQYNMAFAIGRFETAKRYIPGWRNWVSGSTYAYSWPVVILPNMERKDVYNAVTGNPATPPSTYLSFFACPSSPPDSLTGPTLAYVGSAGVGSNATGLRATGVMLDITGTGTMNARVSMDDVASNDGTATTLLLSEECGPQITTQGSWNAQPTQASNGVISWASAAPAFGIVSGSAPTKIINSGTYSTSISSAANMPSSNHPGGVVVTFCNGNTAFLRDSLPGKVYAQLMSWNQTASGTTSPYLTWTGTYTVLQEGDYQ